MYDQINLFSVHLKLLALNKVRYTFQMVMLSEFHIEQYRDDDHREQAPHFINFPKLVQPIPVVLKSFGQPIGIAFLAKEIIIKEYIGIVLIVPWIMSQIINEIDLDISCTWDSESFFVKLCILESSCFMATFSEKKLDIDLGVISLNRHVDDVFKL